MNTSKTVIISGFSVTIDAEDEHYLEMGAWRVIDKDRNRYVKLNMKVDEGLQTVYLHRLIIGAGKGEIVDHINGDSLDNRRENLRFVTFEANVRNRLKRSATSSIFKGVSWDSSKQSWRVQIRIDQRRISKDGFASEFEAAFYYDLLSLEHHAEFGRRNFLPLA